MEYIDDDDDDDWVIVGEVIVERAREREGRDEAKNIVVSHKMSAASNKTPISTAAFMHAAPCVCVCVPRPLSQCDRRMSHLRLPHSLSACLSCLPALPEFVARHM